VSSLVPPDKWSIPTDGLTGPRRTGGLTSLSGLDYQAAYACLQLAYLLDPDSWLKAIRYEGAQDVDLLYADGREKYVQIKNEPDAHYTLSKLRPVLQGLAADLLEAGEPPSLTFSLVARSNHIDAAVTRLRDRVPTPADIIAIAHQLSHRTESESVPSGLVRLNNAERRELVERLLKQTAFEFGMGDEIGGRLSFESHACTELARLGVAGSDLRNAFGALKAALIPRQEFARKDVQEVLKRFVGGAAIDLFEGSAQALTSDLLASRASPERIQQYYSGAPLDWDIIAAGGDIERDQQDGLINQLSQPFESLRLVCIVAEPGAGKSTLAWRLAAELHGQHGAFVIRIRDKEAPDVWYRMSEFCVKVGRPLYVLVDDLFREPEVVEAIRELSPLLAITILATSRANEYRPQRLKGDLVRVSLKGPTGTEKERILERLGKARVGLSTEQQKRLNTANQLLVLMMEITSGKELREIVRDALDRLRRQDESAYLAYEYLCFAYQYSVSIPESLLERINASGRFHNLTLRDTTQGLMFYDEDRAENVRAGHPVIAAAACTFYEALRSPATVLQEILTAAKPSVDLERRFVIRLLLTLARAKSPALSRALSQVEAVVKQCRLHGTVNEIGKSWRAFYRELGETEDAQRCVVDALTVVPTGALDCAMLMKLHRERGSDAEALPILAEWIRQQPNDPVRALYLALVGRKGNVEQVKQVVEETSAWLMKRLEDRPVRTAYLGLVERKGNAEQVKQVVEETSVWLAKHLEDNYVRTAYLGLVERKGNVEQVTQVVEETSMWLATHLEDSSVRTAHLALVGRKGNAEQVKQVVEETSAWLAKHLEGISVRTAHLALVGRKGNAEQVKQVVEETSAWLAKHLEDKYIRAAYLRLVERTGTAGQVREVVEQTSVWLEQHASEKVVWIALIVLLIRTGQPEEGAEMAKKAISHHPNDLDLITQYLRLFNDSADEPVVRKLYERLIDAHPRDSRIETHFAAWLRDHDHLDEARALYHSLTIKFPREVRARHGYGRLMLSLGEFQEAIEQFRTALRLHKGHQMAHQGLAQAWRGLGALAETEGKQREAVEHFTEAEKEFRRALYWADIKEQPLAVFYSSLGWFYLDRHRNEEALEAFESAMEDDPDYFGNYWGAGRAWFGLGQFETAADALRTALAKGGEDLRPPASDEIPELLSQCQGL